jgi:hypothetical protein
MPSVARRPKHAAAVVAAPIVAAVRSEEHVPAAAAVQAGATAWLAGMILDLGGEQLGEEGRKVNGEVWLPVRAAVRVVPRRKALEPALQLVQLPLDMGSPARGRTRAPGRSPRPSAGRCSRSSRSS